MRLLDTSTLRLVSKQEGDVPAYAILSHTWGSDDEEVTFQDVQELSASRIRQPNGPFAHRITKKAGFAKIRDAARVAKAQSYAYIWVDTCCIDKTSSAELSEAINSMFRWYQDAGICYTFLGDVEDDNCDDTDGMSKLIQSIRSSRWFSRGWTLQELIAPNNVYFYSKNWVLLGTRLGGQLGLLQPQSTFPELVSEITGIDLGILSGSLVLDDLSIANKMKWAANRQTTRVEDIAYCLMGIFNVNMPLLYGEGQRAFMRLQEEILKGTNDQSIFAWSCPDNDMLRYQLSGLLASSPEYFRSFGDTKPLPPDSSRASAPSGMTNAGLHVQLSLSKIVDGFEEGPWSESSQQANASSEEYYAILSCYPRSELMDGAWDYYNLAIRLIALGGDQYARVNAQRVFWVSSSKRTTRGVEGTNKYIYVKQIPTYGFPDIIVSHTDGNWGSQYIRLVEVYPRDRWNEQRHTLKPETSTHNSVLGVFRYHVQESGSEDAFVDVYVGISPEQRGPLSWRCWCYQRTVQDRPLPRLHYSALGKDEELSSFRFLDRHAHQGTSETVNAVRQGSKVYISLDLDKMYEMHAVSETRPSDIHELDTGEVGGGALLTDLLTDLAGDPVIEDTWQSSLWLLDDPMSQVVAPRIRVSPKSNPDAHPGEPNRESFGYILTRATKCDLAIEGGTYTEETMFQKYFSLRLVRACIKNDVAAATELLDSPLSTALVEARTSIASEEAEPLHKIFSGFRPLHWASALGHVDTVKLLAKYDADVSSITTSGLSAFHLAGLSGNLETINYLIERTGHLVPQWLDGYNFSEKPAHLVASYVRSKDVNIILGELMFGDAPAQKSANESWDVSEVRLETAAASGIANEFFPSVEKRRNAVALNKLRETPLHRAAAMNNIHAADCILARTIENPLSCEDSFGRTPFWHAAAAGAIEIVKLFLEYGVSVDAPDKLGRTPLHAACRGGHKSVVEELIQAGADIGALTQLGGFTSCHFATLGNSPNILRFLLKHCTEPEQQIYGRPTQYTLAPIHIAAANDFLECAQVLTKVRYNKWIGAEYRIVVNPSSPSGVIVTKLKYLTPLDIAITGHQIDAITFFRGLEYPWLAKKE